MTARSASSGTFQSDANRRQDALSRLAAGSWLELVIIATALLACFATPLLLFRSATNWSAGTQSLAALAVASACFAAMLVLSTRLTLASTRLVRIAETMPVWTIVGLGLLLRVGWNVAFPAQAGSDGAVYVSLAAKLAAGEPYSVAGTFAYWPVGYPLYLSAWMALLGPGKAAWLASNFALYVFAVLGVGRLAKLVSGPGAGKLAALLFSIWPNLVANTATPEKEMLLVALLPWAMAFVVAGVQRRFDGWYLAAAGALFGFCILVQPSLQLFPMVAVILLFGLTPDRRRAAVGAAALLLAAAAVLAPWTLRNYGIFDRFIPVSTGGGSVLYRANNPLATGGYASQGAIDLSTLSETEQDLRGRRLAVEWIRSDPLRFAELAIEKQLRFAGDDAVGVYGTFKTGNASVNPFGYALFKAAANAFWMLAWLGLAALCLGSQRQSLPMPPLLLVPFWLWLYLFAIHSVFESTGKYHVPAVWVLPVLLAGYAVAASQRLATAVKVDSTLTPDSRRK